MQAPARLAGYREEEAWYMSYEHSEVFASLKVVKEEVKVNLTTAQWLQTLDFFIESALDPIVTAWPAFLDSFFAKVVAWQVTRPSIKFSRIEKADLAVHFFNAVTTDGRTKRLHQKKMLLNRGVLLGCVRLFLQTVNDYKQVVSCSTKLSRVDRDAYVYQFHERTGCSQHLYSAIRQSEFYEEKATHFKSLIVQKYIRLALTNAQRAYKMVEFRERLDDIIQIYLGYMSRAIDRCDTRQGVLTTFIQSWFHSARCEVIRKVGETMNSSYDELSDAHNPNAGHTDPDATAETMQHVAYTAKLCDPHGVVRHRLGIPEFYSKKEIAQLQLFVKH
jgi:predicted acetyltransferase